MHDLTAIAPIFVNMAHKIASCSAATVDALGRPRSSIMRPLWQWDGESLIGWIATTPAANQVANLKLNPYISFSYWSTAQDSCVADCQAGWVEDRETRVRVWEMLQRAPLPLGFDPTIIPAWTSPHAPSFSVLHAVPWRLWVFPGDTANGLHSKPITWSAPSFSFRRSEPDLAYVAARSYAL